MSICSTVINPFFPGETPFPRGPHPIPAPGTASENRDLGIGFGVVVPVGPMLLPSTRGRRRTAVFADETCRSLAPLHVAQTLHMVWAESRGKTSTSVTGQEFPISCRDRILVRRKALDRVRDFKVPHTDIRRGVVAHAGDLRWRPLTTEYNRKGMIISLSILYCRVSLIEIESSHLRAP
jgi:hypothetical protein